MTKELTTIDADRIRMLAQAGATDHEIAQALGVPICEIATHPALQGALDSEEGRKRSNERVRRALYANATGYRYRSEKVTGNGDVVPYMAEVLPDPAAQSKWLEASDPKTWGRQGKLQIDAGPTLAQLIEKSFAMRPEPIDITPRDGREALPPGDE